jgi:N-acetylglucosaminyldiphosphoundecaprenol N-acetyl-beta-D-mannosaminyltransferase
MAAKKFPTFEICGVEVAAINLSRARMLLEQCARDGNASYVTLTGAHGIVESAHHPQIREAHKEASIVLPDGMPLVWLGRLLGFKSMGRVYGPDLMEAVFASKELRQLRHFFYGSNPFVVAQLKEALSSRFGTFNLVGEFYPPMRAPGFEESEEVLSQIRQLRPQVIWVSLSTPKQELWLAMHMRRIGSGVGVGVGAAFDLLSGATRQAPRWIQRSGFEWLFRMLMEPRRLFGRYSFIVPRFSNYFVRTLLRKGRPQTSADHVENYR